MGVAEQVKDALQSEAYIRGRRDGKLRLSRGLNPYSDGTAEAAEYERGWQSSTSEAAAIANAAIYRDRLTRYDGDAGSDRDSIVSSYGRAA